MGLLAALLVTYYETSTHLWQASVWWDVAWLVFVLIPGVYQWSPGETATYSETVSSEHGVVEFVSTLDWIPSFHIQYKVGLDGLSLPLVILSTFICLLACIASWNIEKMLKGYMALFLFLESGIMGVFLSLDFFLFYIKLTLLNRNLRRPDLEIA